MSNAKTAYEAYAAVVGGAKTVFEELAVEVQKLWAVAASTFEVATGVSPEPTAEPQPEATPEPTAEPAPEAVAA